jgi:sucrose-6-phosphate hydrolase SacC (GH32 family)
MNDPNGLFRDNEGLWHMYYQCKLLLTTSAVVVLAERK